MYDAWAAMTESRSASFSLSSWPPFISHLCYSILTSSYHLHRYSIFGLKVPKEALKPWQKLESQAAMAK